jgi:Domain of unknown function (DUF4365)
MYQNRATENIGLRHVKRIVLEKWLSTWQEFDHQNDDGFDGIIYLTKRKTDTGGALFVQIKTGSSYKKSYKKRPDYIPESFPNLSTTKMIFCNHMI